MADVRGTFWCDECRADFPDALRDRHIASHDTAHEDDGSDPFAFWVFSFAIGAALGLVVLTLSQL
jgi:hypothetical protein